MFTLVKTYYRNNIKTIETKEYLTYPLNTKRCT